MFPFTIFILCVQACLIQTAMSQRCCQATSCDYGGQGCGVVSAAGPIDACGSTCVTGSVPVLGSSCFSGCSPTCGSVTINGKCSCDCQSERTLLSSSGSTYIPNASGSSSSGQSVSRIQQSAPCISIAPSISLNTPSSFILPVASIPTPITKSSISKPSIGISPRVCKAPSVNSQSASTSIISAIISNGPCGQSSPSVSVPSVSSSSNTPRLSQSSSSISKSSPSLSAPSVSLSSPRVSLSKPSVSVPSASLSSPRISVSKPSVSLASGIASSLQSCGSYGGQGCGMVDAAGTIDACGSTCVTGKVPVIGSVGFSGCSPTCGSVIISGQCECECD